ncbi:MAG: lysophospholipid acyltransferase family protein [Acidobacteriota bacterium]
MRAFRVLWRLPAILVWTLGIWLTLLVGLVALWPLSAARRDFRRWIFKTWSRGFLRILNVRATVRGPRPPEPTLLISNHLSYLDIMLLAAEIPGCFVAKAEIRSWPLAGWICRTVSTIFVDRELRRDVLRVGALMEQALSRGDSVVLFPEGTSTCGRDVAPFKSPLLAPAAAAGLAIHTASVSYDTAPEDHPAHDAVCWWGEAPFAPHLRLMLEVRRIDAVIAFGEARLSHGDRKELTRLAHDQVTENFRPVVDFEPVDPWAGHGV